MVSESQSAVDLSQTFDVLVIGGGNAALCAAMTAREAGATVLLLECSPKDFRGVTAGIHAIWFTCTNAGTTI